MRTVEKQPPPSFFAPYPAARPRSSLLMHHPRFQGNGRTHHMKQLSIRDRILPLTLRARSFGTLGIVALLSCAGGDRGAMTDTAVLLPCGLATSGNLTTSGVGDLRIGLPAGDVGSRCTVASDTMESGPEGQERRVMRVRAGVATVLAEVVHDSVWRLTVSDSTIRTREGLGVGSSLGDLLEAGASWVGQGEGRTFVGVAQHCGLSFRLRPGEELSRAGNVNALREAPPETLVDQVLVLGPGTCPPR